jgi:hypothetical protein
VYIGSFWGVGLFGDIEMWQWVISLWMNGMGVIFGVGKYG